MPYAPPAGFIEETPAPDDGRHQSAFHTRTDCPRVSDPDGLRPAARPYSAVRCTLCAPL